MTKLNDAMREALVGATPESKQRFHDRIRSGERFSSACFSSAELWKALEIATEALEESEEKREHASAVDDWAWEKMVRIGRRIRARAYPKGIFDGSSGDPGPVLLAAIGAALDALPEEDSDAAE